MRFGVEYTFLHPDPTSVLGVIPWIYGYDELATRLKRKGFEDAHNDGCLEVPSPIHKSLRDAEVFYKRLIKATRGLNVSPRIIRVDKRGAETYEGTGGGHVHVEMPKSHRARVSFLKQLIPIVANRPWLNWVFNEFMDEDNANALIFRSRVLHYLTIGTFEEDALGYRTEDPYIGMTEMLNSGDYAISLGNLRATVEYRFFDAPRSWRQSKEHIEFALALTKFALKKVKLKAPPEELLPSLVAIGDMGSFGKAYTNVRSVEVLFKELVKTLGLDWRRYKKYLKNFEDRLAFGKLT